MFRKLPCFGTERGIKNDTVNDTIVSFTVSAMSMGYKKDIFAGFAYEFELLQK